MLPNTPSVNDRFPLEGTVPGLRGSLGINGADLTGKGNRLGYIDPNIDPARFGPRASNPFLDLIGRAEGTDRGRGYNETLGYGAFTGGPQNLTGMSLDQIDALQSRMLAHPENDFNSSALGRYQIVQKTRRGLQSEMGLSGSELFDEGMQDKMALRLMERRGNNVAGLRNEWEGLRRVDPSTIQNAYAGSTVDPAATAGIDQLNAKLTAVGTTAAQTAPAFDTLKAANQNMANSTMMAGTNVQLAGTNAATAGPQFTQAGTAIATAGQTASMAGQQASTASTGVGGFGQGISALLGPLAQAVPGLGQFGGMILQLLSSLGGGMGGIAGGLFSEGGYSTSAVASASLPAGVWANAPSYADGTVNTSGGLPSILHPNEAVIPLTRGREIPVDLGNDNRPEPPRDPRQRPVTMNFNGFKDIDTIRRTKQSVKASALAGMQRAQMRNA